MSIYCRYLSFFRYKYLFTAAAFLSISVSDWCWGSCWCQPSSLCGSATQPPQLWWFPSLEHYYKNSTLKIPVAIEKPKPKLERRENIWTWKTVVLSETMMKIVLLWRAQRKKMSKINMEIDVRKASILNSYTCIWFKCPCKYSANALDTGENLSFRWSQYEPFVFYVHRNYEISHGRVPGLTSDNFTCCHKGKVRWDYDLCISLSYYTRTVTGPSNREPDATMSRSNTWPLDEKPRDLSIQLLTYAS